MRSVEHPDFGSIRRGQRWLVALPTNPTLDVSVAVNAGSAGLDLAGARVPTVTVSVNAGEIRLDLSRAAAVGTLDASANAGTLRLLLPAASLTGSVSANLGSVKMCIPDGVGLRLRAPDNPLSSNNFADRGLARNGQDWTSPGYESATTKIDLSTSANAGSITLNPEDGCD